VSFIGWFQVVVGAGILLIWPVLVAAGEVPEIAAGQRDIWFHMTAEAVVGASLLAGGSMLLRRRSIGARIVSAFALGALLYTGINSAGHYADLGEWIPVALLLAVAAVAAWASTALLRSRTHDDDGAAEPTSAASGG
jgi:peptidoglycan/LPS O-acetylase OafA/YrhL